MHCQHIIKLGPCELVRAVSGNLGSDGDDYLFPVLPPSFTLYFIVLFYILFLSAVFFFFLPA